MLAAYHSSVMSDGGTLTYLASPFSFLHPGYRDCWDKGPVLVREHAKRTAEQPP